MKFFRQYWSLFLAIAAVLGTIGAVFGFDGRYAKSCDIDEIEVRTVQSLERYQEQQDKKFDEVLKSIRISNLQQRYTWITNQIMSLRIDLRKYPNDEFLKQEYLDLLKKKAEIEKLIEKETDL